MDESGRRRRSSSRRGSRRPLHMAASRLPEPWPDSGQDAKKRFSRLGKRAREQVDVDDSDGDDGDPGGEPEHNPPGPVAGKMKTGVTAKVKTCHFTPTRTPLRVFLGG